MISCFLSFCTLTLFYLPLILMGHHLYNELFIKKEITFGARLVSFSVVIVTAVSTIICGLILSATYLVDLVESLKKDFADSYEPLVLLRKIIKTISSIVNYVNRF